MTHHDQSSSKPTIGRSGRDGMTAYGKLAGLLWARISGGEWPAGTRLPTVAQLAREYDVAAVTVRGALGLLSAQGLIHSRQGRGTIVLERQAGVQLAEGYFDTWLVGPAEAVRVLDRRTGVRLPSNLSDGAPCLDSYVHLRRLHMKSERPVCIVDFFMAQEAYASLPVGIDEGFKIGLLLMTKASPRPVRGRQITTVSTASPEDAELLGMFSGLPIVVVERRFLDEERRVLGAGIHRYPGTVFRQVIDQPVTQILEEMESWLPSEGLARSSDA